MGTSCLSLYIPFDIQPGVAMFERYTWIEEHIAFPGVSPLVP